MGDVVDQIYVFEVVEELYCFLVDCDDVDFDVFVVLFVNCWQQLMEQVGVQVIVQIVIGVDDDVIYLCYFFVFYQEWMGDVGVGLGYVCDDFVYLLGVGM